MEARLVYVSDDQGKGVGLILLTYDVDHDDKVVVSDPILTANDVEELRVCVTSLTDAFEHPILTADEYDAAVEGGEFTDPERPTGLLPDEVDSLVAAREAEGAAVHDGETFNEAGDNVDPNAANVATT